MMRNVGAFLFLISFTAAEALRYTSEVRGGSSSSTLSASDVIYQYSPRATTARPVQEVLQQQQASVIDFGAIQTLLPTEDSTPSFQAALDSSGDWPITVFVPNGRYIIQGTVVLGSGKVLHLSSGAWLKRENCSSSSSSSSSGAATFEPPLVRLTSADATLRGERGARISGIGCQDIPFSKGVVQLGPEHQNPTSKIGINIEWNIISGFSISGNRHHESVGVYCDSTEPFVGGSCYSNTIENLVISDVGVGLAAMKYVNANTFSNLQFGGISKYSILMVNNSENQIRGFFTTGSQNISAVVRGEGSFYNTFVDVQSEPGGGQLLSFDERSSSNNVVGHDNTPHGSSVKDQAFTWVDGGRVNIGNFSAPGATLYGGYQLNVEGTAKITQHIVHGFPRLGESIITATREKNLITTDHEVIKRTFIYEDAPLLIERQVASSSSSSSSSTRMLQLFKLCGFRDAIQSRGGMDFGYVKLDFTGTIEKEEGGEELDEIDVDSQFKVLVKKSGKLRPLNHQLASSRFSSATDTFINLKSENNKEGADDCLLFDLNTPTAERKTDYGGGFDLRGILEVKFVGVKSSRIMEGGDDKGDEGKSSPPDALYVAPSP